MIARRGYLCVLFVMNVFLLQACTQTMKTETYQTGVGALKVTLLGHASLMLEYVGKVIYIDPYSKVADYSKLPKADLILLTHEHADHLDMSAIEQIKTEKTEFVGSKTCHEILKCGIVLYNGDIIRPYGFSIKAVPAYNLVHKRPNGEFFHPKDRGNGYVFLFGKLKMYVAGDTENIPEMAKLGLVDIAFLPKNEPYTMDDSMFLDAVEKVHPRILYPYHYFEFDKETLLPKLKAMGVTVVLHEEVTK